jgi:hypothetical protein
MDFSEIPVDVLKIIADYKHGLDHYAKYRNVLLQLKCLELKYKIAGDTHFYGFTFYKGFINSHSSWLQTNQICARCGNIRDKINVEYVNARPVCLPWCGFRYMHPFFDGNDGGCS